MYIWLVASTPLKNISQLGLLFPIKTCSKPPTSIYIYTCVYIYIHNIGLQSMSIDFLQTQIGAAKSLAEILDNVAERKTWRFRNPDSKVQQKHNHSHWFSISYPIGSMHAIYGNIYHQYTPNVSIYTIHGSLYHIRIVQWTPPKKFLQWPKICSFHVQPLYKHTTHTHNETFEIRTVFPRFRSLTLFRKIT